MLGKVIKYEFRDLLRSMVPLWIALPVSALVCRVGTAAFPDDSFAGKVITGLGSFLLVLLVMGTSAALVALIIRSFAKGLLGEGGYLSFSLPVSEHAQLGGRLIAAVTMTVLTVLAEGGSLLLLSLNRERGLLNQLAEGLHDLFRSIGDSAASAVTVVEFVLAVLLVLALSVLGFYSAIAVGHLFGAHRGLKAFAFYILRSWVLRIAGVVLTLFLARSTLLRKLLQIAGAQAGSMEPQELLELLTTFGGGFLLMLLAFCAVRWAYIVLILKKKLNIQ